MSSRLLTCPPDFSCPPAHSLVVMIHATSPGDPLMDTYYGWIGAPVVARLQPVQPCCLRNCSMWGCVSAEGSRVRFAEPARRRWWSRHRASRDKHSCGAQPFPRHPDRPGRDCVSWVSSSLRSETALRPSLRDGFRSPLSWACSASAAQTREPNGGGSRESRPQGQHLALRMRSEAHEEGGWVIDSGYVVSGES